MGISTLEGGDVVDVAVEAADGVPAEALGLPGQGAQRGVHGGIREKGPRVLHRRLAPELTVAGRRRHGELAMADGSGRGTNKDARVRYLLKARRPKRLPLLFWTY